LGDDGDKEEVDSKSIIIFTQNETLGISAIDKELVFIAMLHGTP